MPKMPFSKEKDDWGSYAVYAGGSKKSMPTAKSGFTNQIDKGNMIYTTGQGGGYSNPAFEAKKKMNEEQAKYYEMRASQMAERNESMKSRSVASSKSSKGSMFGKVGPVLKGGLNIGPQSGAFGAVNPFAQLNSSIYFGFTQIGFFFIFVLGWYLIGKSGGMTIKQIVSAFASTSLFYILMIEVMNMIFDFIYLSTSGTFKTIERVGSLIILLSMLSGAFMIPVLVGFTMTYLALSGVLVVFAWGYIVCPGNPVFNIPFGFLSLYLICVLLCMMLNVPFDFKLGFEPVVPLLDQIYGIIKGAIR